jgi:hypothetical protein
MIRDVHPGSGIRILIFYSFRITDSGVKKAPDPGSGSATLVVDFCWFLCVFGSETLDLVSVWYGMVWYGMAWYGMVWYGMVPMVWYGMVWYGMVWYGPVWCSEFECFPRILQR